MKSLLRCRCVSKLWCSIITSQDFGNRHFNITSYSAPRLLIAFVNFRGEKLLLVSSPNLSVFSSFSSSRCVPYKDMNILKIDGIKVFYGAVRGFICFRSRLRVGIRNPSTGELPTFPQFKNYPVFCTCNMYFYFGYDPVEDQYKVLIVDYSHGRSEHKVLVVGYARPWF